MLSLTHLIPFIWSSLSTPPLSLSVAQMYVTVTNYFGLLPSWICCWFQQHKTNWSRTPSSSNSCLVTPCHLRMTPARGRDRDRASTGAPPLAQPQGQGGAWWRDDTSIIGFERPVNRGGHIRPKVAWRWPKHLWMCTAWPSHLSWLQACSTGARSLTHLGRSSTSNRRCFASGRAGSGNWAPNFLSHLTWGLLERRACADRPGRAFQTPHPIPAKVTALQQSVHRVVVMISEQKGALSLTWPCPSIRLGVPGLVSVTGSPQRRTGTGGLPGWGSEGGGGGGRGPITAVPRWSWGERVRGACGGRRRVSRTTGRSRFGWGSSRGGGDGRWGWGWWGWGWGGWGGGGGGGGGGWRQHAGSQLVDPGAVRLLLAVDLDLGQGAELVRAHAALVLKLLQLQHGPSPSAPAPCPSVAGHALVGQAGVPHRVHHLALLAHVAHVHGGLGQAGSVQRAHRRPHLAQALAVLRVVRQGAGGVLHALRHGLDGLGGDLQQGQRRAEGQRVVGQNVLRACEKTRGNKLFIYLLKKIYLFIEGLYYSWVNAQGFSQVQIWYSIKTCTLQKHKTYKHNLNASPFGIALVKNGN